MGTFHQHKGELHGITVVVETSGPELWVGRCDEVAEHGVVLHDADVHRDDAGAVTRAQWLARAAAVGIWPRHPRVVIPRATVTGIRRLGEVE